MVNKVEQTRLHRGGRIADAIKRSGKSQREIADAVGVTPQSITKWMKTGKIYAENLLSLADITETDIRYLINGETARQVTENTAKYHLDNSVLHELIDQLTHDQVQQLTLLANALKNGESVNLKLEMSFGGTPSEPFTE